MTPDESPNGRSMPSAVAWIPAALGFGVAVVLVAAQERDEGPMFALLAALATAVVALLLALLARYAWTRLGGGRGTLASPSLLVIAALVSLAVLGGRALQEGSDAAARADAAEQCTTQSPNPFPAPSGDLAYRGLTAEERERLRTLAANLSETGMVGGKHVLFGEQDVANMGAVPGYQDPAERDELFDRINEAASAGALDVRSVDELQAPGVLAIFQGKPWLITTSGCYAILMGGEDEQAVVYVAQQLFRADASSGG